MGNAIYAPDKPRDCSLCYFWEKKKGCSLGGDNCYYLISTPEKTNNECDGCPYGRHSPCIGWCTKQLLQELGIR